MLATKKLKYLSKYKQGVQMMAASMDGSLRKQRGLDNKPFSLLPQEMEELRGSVLLFISIPTRCVYCSGTG